MPSRLKAEPAHYRQDWLEVLDRRTRLARVVEDRLRELESDLGGHDVLSYQQRSLARRALWIELIIERRESALAQGLEIEEGQHGYSVNTLKGLFVTLGLHRKAKEAPSLHEYLAKKATAATQDGQTASEPGEGAGAQQ